MTSSDGITKILIAGEGGQGVQVIAEILTLAAKEQNEETSYIPNFGVEQRNGVSIAFVQLGQAEISYPKFSTADILIAMCDRSIEAIKEFADENTLVIFDGSNIRNDLLLPLKNKYEKFINLPARRLANEKLTPKTANVILMGAILSQLPELGQETVRRIMNEKFKKYTEKNPDLGRMNNEAFDLGLRSKNNSLPAEFKGSEEITITRMYENDRWQWERLPEYCKSCGLCIERCPVQALTWSKDLNQRGTPLPQVNIESCTACQTCQKVCPDGAIKVNRK